MTSYKAFSGVSDKSHRARTTFRSVALISALIATPLSAGEWEADAAIALETRVFFEDPAYAGQLEHHQPSITFSPEFRWTDQEGKHQLVILPYARLDAQDKERTHTDLREAYYRYIGDNVEVLLGASKVFWGVTESRHLVDIINQTDTVEDVDEEDKLGQPMVMISFLRNWGQVDLFYLPYARQRAYPGTDGRLRFPFVVDGDDAIFTGENEEWTPGFAAHYAHYIGALDFSMNIFHGPTREPVFRPSVTGSFVPIYDDITQIGTTIQYTKDAWLWKFEGIWREGQGDSFTAAVGGLEYTFYGITENGADLGVLLEYQTDGRDTDGSAPFTIADNDVFVGARYARNDIQDTSFLAGAVTDVEDGSISALIEAERRIGDHWTAEVEGRFFSQTDDDHLLHAFRKDSHLTIKLTRYF